MNRARFIDLAAVSVCTAAAHAQITNEDTFYFPTPTLQGGYGTAVDVSAGIMIVGAPFDADMGVSAGAAYLVDLDSGMTIGKLTPPGVGTGDFFGSSVAISGNLAVVGAPEDSDLNSLAGAVYVFQADTGVFLRRIEAPGASAGFGTDVDIDASLLLVGAPDFDNGGEAFLYDATTGALLQTFDKQSSFGFDRFGQGVAVDAVSGIAAVGAVEEFDPTINERIGSVHLFDVNTGSLLRSLIPPSTTEFTAFGSSVDITGTLLLIGAPEAPDGLSDAGAAFLFDPMTGALVHELRIDDSPAPTQFNKFGFDVALGEGVALVGSPEWDFAGTGEGFNNGAGFLFDISTGDQIATLVTSVATLGDRIGNGVGIDGSTVVLGIPGDDYTGGFDAGSVAIFTVPCQADLNNDGLLNFFDLSAFIGLYNAGDPGADLAAPFGTLNFFDIAEYIALFNAGCP